jgi:hypothetical protein
MKSLELKDRLTFQRYLGLRKHNLSAFSFVNIFIWKDIFKIFWEIIDDALCVFIEDSVGCFMFLPPLGRNSREIINNCFSIMDKLNINKSISRIENVEKDDLQFYSWLGFKYKFKTNEYVYLRNDLVSLTGNRYKSKRYAQNYFAKNYNFKYQEYTIKLKDECIALYKEWARDRALKYNNSIYKKMLKDSCSTNLLVMNYFKELEIVGRIIKVDDKTKGYSFGFRLNNDTFCVLFEITDLKIKGLSQYIFREFIREQNGFLFVNAMDDSGLENLKKVKISYRPIRLEPSFIISRH